RREEHHSSGGYTQARRPGISRRCSRPRETSPGRTATTTSRGPYSGEYSSHDLLQGQAGRVQLDRAWGPHQGPHGPLPVLRVALLNGASDRVGIAPLLPVAPLRAHL